MATIRDFLSFFTEKGLKIEDINVDQNQIITAPKNILEAKMDNLTFLSRKLKDDLEKVMTLTGSRLIIVETDLMPSLMMLSSIRNVALVLSDNPKKSMIDAMNHFFQERDEPASIHPTSLIHESVRLGQNLRIGPNVVIEEDVEIDDGCTIEANTVIKKGTRLGKNVRIKSCSVIGGVGFGYDKGDDETAYQFLPHFGRVIIEDDVDIGSNTCIDRGSLSDTIIRKGVKIDNLVHIAHNVQIGENSLVIACSMIAGSVTIGDNCWIAPGASIRNGLTIGNNSTVGLGSVLTNDLGDSATVLGVPAIDIEDFKFLRSHQKKILMSRNPEDNKK
jgi:UDP-3-O-[3-hydroxymyristoyl] glucosamine N-acyltransferase